MALPFDFTKEEMDKALKGLFTSQNPLVLSRIPRQYKRQVAVLIRIADNLPAGGATFTEKGITQWLFAIHPQDPVTLRRGLIDIGLLSRTPDGASYWKSVP